ncbi:YxeA family protein [Kurthia huakuii]|uniref:YxeA family protein n=1 Tax=Kurthia huakuii TaxID=1421019 RepID=UPI00049621EF|nr:YxeA family protein [Kurthia huakuii]MBM7700675.1 uncharacterized protein (TIGR01655 family) [Kurthia huakuii]
MKKFLLTIAILFVVCLGALYALMTIDFNRMNADHYYVQITEDGEVSESRGPGGQVYKDYNYKLPAYNEQGDERELVFRAQKNLRHDAYLKMYVKEDGVSSYDEVKFDDIPAKAQAKLQ